MTDELPASPDLAAMEALVREGDLESATQLLRAAVARAPSLEAWSLLGRALAAQGDVDGARKAFDAANHADPLSYKPLLNLAHLERASGNVDAAIVLYERALDVEPGLASGLSGLGAALHATGKLDAAKDALERALSVAPEGAGILVRLARVVRDRDGADAAEALLRKHLAAHPADSLVLGELATSLHRSGKTELAAPLLEEAARIDPPAVEVLVALGDNLRRRGSLSSAEGVLNRALAIDSAAPKAELTLATVSASVGDFEAFDEHFERAVAAKEPTLDELSMRLYYLVHDERQTPKSLRAEHRAWGIRAEQGRAASKRATSRARGGPLRIGYLSPDFRTHVVAQFMEGVLAAHDRRRFEVTLLSYGAVRDEVTARFAAATPMIDLSGSRGREGFASAITALDLDVLVDLAGHSGKPALHAMAERLALVQATYLGYPSTTGLSSVDYRITDEVTDPEGAEEEFVERLYRLPGPSWSYAPSVPLPETTRRAASDPAVVFGCFNRLDKLSPTVLRAWQRILRERPTARLVMKASALADEGVRARMADRLAVDVSRLSLRPWTGSPEEHYRSYQELDVALDTSPYNGTTTTCDALFMGVPVVTLRGSTSASRVGATLLSAVGLERCVTHSVDAYVSSAIALHDDAPARARFRAELRARALGSPLGSPRRLARQLEDAYDAMVRAALTQKTTGDASAR